MNNLIGPLTADEWMTLTLGHDDDPLYCCAVTSAFRSALFHVLRMGGDYTDGHWTLANPWAALHAYHGGTDDITSAPVIEKIRAFYKLDERDDVPADAHPASLRSDQPHEKANIERLLVDNADLRADNEFLREHLATMTQPNVEGAS